jgi:hypothetical protein
MSRMQKVYVILRFMNEEEHAANEIADFVENAVDVWEIHRSRQDAERTVNDMNEKAIEEGRNWRFWWQEAHVLPRGG